MVATSNTDLIRAGYAAFAVGDMTALEQLLSPDCIWYVSGANALTGTYHGRDATFDYFGQLLGRTGGTFAVTPSVISEVAPDEVLVIARAVAEVGEQSYDDEVVQRFAIHDGQVMSCRTYSQNSALFDALIGPAVISLDQPAPTRFA